MLTAKVRFCAPSPRGRMNTEAGVESANPNGWRVESRTI